MMTIGENIKTARKALHMSQEDLALAIDANRITISKYETGRYLPSVPALEKLATALHTTTSALYGNDPQVDDTDFAPVTSEARILSRGIDKLPKAQREQALSVVRAMFAQFADYFSEETQDAP